MNVPLWLSNSDGERTGAIYDSAQGLFLAQTVPREPYAHLGLKQRKLHTRQVTSPLYYLSDSSWIILYIRGINKRAAGERGMRCWDQTQDLPHSKHLLHYTACLHSWNLGTVKLTYRSGLSYKPSLGWPQEYHQIWSTPLEPPPPPPNTSGYILYTKPMPHDLLYSFQRKIHKLCMIWVLLQPSFKLILWQL